MSWVSVNYLAMHLVHNCCTYMVGSYTEDLKYPHNCGHLRDGGGGGGRGSTCLEWYGSITPQFCGGFNGSSITHIRKSDTYRPVITLPLNSRCTLVQYLPPWLRAQPYIPAWEKEEMYHLIQHYSIVEDELTDQNCELCVHCHTNQSQLVANTIKEQWSYMRFLALHLVLATHQSSPQYVIQSDMVSQNTHQLAVIQIYLAPPPCSITCILTIHYRLLGITRDY